jgi:hypothetical protein
LLRVEAEKNDEKYKKKLFIGKNEREGRRWKWRSERVFGKDGYKSKCLYWTNRTTERDEVLEKMLFN